MVGKKRNYVALWYGIMSLTLFDTGLTVIFLTMADDTLRKRRPMYKVIISYVRVHGILVFNSDWCITQG